MMMTIVIYLVVFASTILSAFMCANCPHSTLGGRSIVSSTFQMRKWGREWLSDLPKVTLLESGKARKDTQSQ